MDILLYQEKSPSVFSCLACSRRSHSGVRREVREREKIWGETTPSLFFFSAHISLRRSERVAQSIRSFMANGSNKETQRVFFNWKYRWHHLTNFGSIVNGTA